MEHSLSVIVPALNEEGNIADTVDTVSSALKDKVGEFEILIFDDGSQDRTGGPGHAPMRGKTGFGCLNGK